MPIGAFHSHFFVVLQKNPGPLPIQFESVLQEVEGGGRRGVFITHTLLWQVYPVPQLPQFKLPPHPSDTVPQFLPNPRQVAGVQAEGTSATVMVIVSESRSSPSETVKVMVYVPAWAELGVQENILLEKVDP